MSEPPPIAESCRIATSVTLMDGRLNSLRVSDIGVLLHTPAPYQTVHVSCVYAERTGRNTDVPVRPNWSPVAWDPRLIRLQHTGGSLAARGPRTEMRTGQYDGCSGWFCTRSTLNWTKFTFFFGRSSGKALIRVKKVSDYGALKVLYWALHEK